MKKKHIIILAIVFFVSIILTMLIIYKLNNTNIKKIEKNLIGVRISKSSLEVLEEVTVNIDGYISKSDNGFSFTGDLQFSNLEFSKSDIGTLIYGKAFGEDGLENRGIINYFRNILKDGIVKGDVATVHWVETDYNLSYLVLTNYDDDSINNPPNDSVKEYNGNDILVFPATDVASALALIEEHKINQKIFLETSIEDYIN
jgi:hypothetical protein